MNDEQFLLHDIVQVVDKSSISYGSLWIVKEQFRDERVLVYQIYPRKERIFYSNQITKLSNGVAWIILGNYVYDEESI